MDNSGCNGGCSKAKRSKSSDEFMINSKWAYLPSIVLHEIFEYLSYEDRKNASSVCHNWRQIIFHPKWWSSAKFDLEQHNVSKVNFYIATLGRIVSEATVSLNSLSPTCLNQFVILLRTFSENNHFRNLLLEPTHCRFEIPQKYIEDSVEVSNTFEIVNLLTMVLPRLNKFSIGCVEEFAHNMEILLKNLTPSKVTLLGLASVKDDPVKYEPSYFNLELLAQFRNLQILSVDYDHLSDEFLYKLEKATLLSRLVVHLHAVQKNHPGSTNEAWIDFKRAHPQCMLRLSVIHAYKEIAQLHVTVLKEQMPLSHLKVFFCENVNMEVLRTLPTFYANTLRSVIWIDSLSDCDYSWKCSKSSVNIPDPFILMSWQCLHFEELIIYGYKYCEYNLVAIGRLRGPKLTRLEIPQDDILFSDSLNVYCIDDISSNLQRPWKPLKRSELHPVILDPVAGDSDEFLLPYVLADLR
ncbi:F-box/LRR-repeat protein 3 isoform X2 [Cylas formicarius]|uniref:F-box/LRR-repeat protein 3 isoform X2 n=1 Tax=Cylas formicarius TaxID=197179 RepID=UPI002958DED0|nr:F-box/LRR-repeat protein 3 isoform X2 [Cylas formicarius]